MTEYPPALKSLIVETVVEQSRIRILNYRELNRGLYVLYWMRNSHRASMNPSLNFAVEAGNRLNLPVVVFFQLNNYHHGGYLRHYSFMLEGLEEVYKQLTKKGILFILRSGDPAAGLAAIAAEASAVVTDSGYLKYEREAEADAARTLACPLVSVESSVIVPLNSLSGREEYAASTLRPKLKKILPAYLDPRPDPGAQHSSLNMKLESEDIALLLNKPAADASVPAVPGVRGGTGAARRMLDVFVQKKLRVYNEQRNDPDLDATSHLSPYLHFGHISPVEAALAVIDTGDPNAEKFLDELIVRRELGFNFVRFNDSYDNINSIQSWAYDSLMMHKCDARDYVYSLEEFEHSGTHDPYWNAAQNQLVRAGTIHNYMRMYWGKKIIEWSRSPEQAYEYMVYLNNKYALDGSDPNSYAGIAWCFGKHDRPWGSRPVFGKVRYMNDRGLKRKFSMNVYLEKYPDERRGI
ncbi:MAG TPA: deoxyribodipyrimidine photo-lyase [Spirochaetota bacterium]|nr:deoxyribodipyrimidine photo-lyase [Spirochaetota bacterium]